MEKRLLAAAPVKLGVTPAPNSEGVGARDSITTDGCGPPVMERGSGEVSPNAWKGLAEGSRVVLFLPLEGIVVGESIFPQAKRGKKGFEPMRERLGRKCGVENFRRGK